MKKLLAMLSSIIIACNISSSIKADIFIKNNYKDNVRIGYQYKNGNIGNAELIPGQLFHVDNEIFGLFLSRMGDMFIVGLQGRKLGEALYKYNNEKQQHPNEDAQIIIDETFAYSEPKIIWVPKG